MKRENADETKPNNKIVKNYCKTAVENFRGYICGKPITYTSNEEKIDITPLLDVLKSNDFQNTDSEWLKNALIFGFAPELCYINEKSEKHFKNISPEQVIPVYSADLDEELLYVIYFYPIVDWDSDAYEPRYSVNVYDREQISHFTCDSSFVNMVPDGEVESHYFDEVPFSIFYLTDDGEPIFKCVMSLQDAYNKLLSDSVNDWESFVDAYMVLTNITADAEDIAAMKKNRVLILDDDATASYLTKPTSDTKVDRLLDELNTAIHTIANSPDFSSEEFGSGVSSGIALQFKLVGFNNIASNIESQFRKALQQRVKLLNNVFTLIDMAAFDVDISFTHNLPQNVIDIADTIGKLRGLVSDATLMAQLPFINDIDAELNRVNAEKEANMAMYNFNVSEETEDE
jgi:SPP1 family phage portal protein